MHDQVSAGQPAGGGSGAPAKAHGEHFSVRASCRTLAVLVLAGLAACGGKNEGVGSSATPPMVTGLSLSPGTTLLKANQTETFTASAMMSSGPAQAVQPVWKSDNAAVLTIDAAGVARGISNGAATITATHGGVSENRRIRVVTDFQGSWAGDYIVRTCSHSGNFRSAEFCDREEGFWAGDQFPISLSLTQDRAAVTGVLALGEIAGTLRGAVDESGQLTATAASTLSVGGQVLTFNVPTFAAHREGERLSGSFALDVTAAGLSGQGHVDADLRIVEQTAAATAPARHGGSHSFGSWPELLHAVTGRR